MLKEVMQSIEGIATYPVVSLVLFIIAFLAVLYAVWRLSPAEIEHAGRLPLDDDHITSENQHDRV